MNNQTQTGSREVLKSMGDHDNRSLSVITARNTDTDRGTFPTETAVLDVKSPTAKSATSSIGVQSPVEASQRAESIDGDDGNLTLGSDESHICEALVSDSNKISDFESLSNEVKVHVDKRLLDKPVNYLLAAKESAMSTAGQHVKKVSKEGLQLTRGQTFILHYRANDYWMLTNKHVVCQNKNDNKIKTLYCRGACEQSNCMVNFSEYKFITHGMVTESLTEHPLDVPGKWGIDLASKQISQATRDDNFKPIRSFKPCDSHFDYRVGTQIAIAIHKAPRTEDVTLQQCNVEEKSALNLNEYFGRESSVTILKGKIIETGESYFYHDINSYRGCSGAAIFLLNDIAAGNEYPLDHRLTAIGVHAGHSRLNSMNYAFKLKVEDVPQPEGRKTLSAFLDKTNPSTKVDIILKWLDEQGVHSLATLCQKLSDSSNVAFREAFLKRAGLDCFIESVRLLE